VGTLLLGLDQELAHLSGVYKRRVRGGNGRLMRRRDLDGDRR
jgi:hypothetical protein